MQDRTAAEHDAGSPFSGEEYTDADRAARNLEQVDATYRDLCHSFPMPRTRTRL